MKNKCTRVTALLLPAAVLLAALNGCVGYQLGSMLPPDVKTVYVPTFINKTDEPLVEVETTQAVLEALQLDGSLKVAQEDDADAILEVTIYDFALNPVAFDRGNQRTLANEFRLTLSANVLLKRRATDAVIVQNPVVRGETTFEVLGDISSGKRDALPDAAKDLAHDIVERIVEVW